MGTPTSITFAPTILALITSGRIDGGQLLTALLPAVKASTAGATFSVRLGAARNRPGWTLECRADGLHAIHLLKAIEDEESMPARRSRSAARPGPA